MPLDQSPSPVVRSDKARRKTKQTLAATYLTELPIAKSGRQTIVEKLDIPAMTTEEIDAAAYNATEVIRIEKPRLRTASIVIRGIAPYVQHKFSEKNRKMMEATQRAGQQARGKKTRLPKDFEQIYKDAMHISRDGWCGIPCPAFRNAMIDACRLVGFKMTHAKMSVFVEADGFDDTEGTPLVKISGEPHIHEAAVRNDSGVADIRWRPMWDEGWTATVTVRWDLDQFSATDIVHLMMRAGLQVGIGEGRPFSPKSNGLGWGRFEVVS